MGVPQLFRWLADRYRCAVLTLPAGTPMRGECASLYIDFNSMIHMCARQALGTATGDLTTAAADELVVSATLCHLDDLILRVRPTHTVYVAVDGLPPRSKLHQQRGRRFVSAWKRETSMCADPPNVRAWDSNAVTPGTAFMALLGKRLVSHASSSGDRGIRARVIVSGSDEPGEGEQKIFTRIRSDEDGGGKVIVYGLDADLLLMGATSPARARMSVVREAHIGGGVQVVDIRSIASGLCAVMRSGEAGGGEDVEDLIADFVALCMLVGNDFVPSLPGLSIKDGAIDKLISLHARARRTLRLPPGVRLWRSGPEAAGGLHLGLLSEVLRGVAEVEGELLAAADRRYYARCKRAERLPPGARHNPEELYPALFPSLPEGTLRPGDGSAWRIRYHHHLLGVDGSGLSGDDDLRLVCVTYLAGLSWAFNYLALQKCIAWGWWYAHAYAPTALDLHNALADTTLPAALDDELERRCEVPPLARQAPGEWQLLMVLPPGSAGLLAHVHPRLRAVMDEDAFGCRHMFPTGFRMATYLCEKMHECVPLLPPVDTKILCDAISDVMNLTPL